MPDSGFREKLARRAYLAGLHLPDGTFSSLESYFQLLQKWNRSISLTSLPVDDVTDEALDRLFIEPLLASSYVPPNARVLDIGSGGGSPAIPLKLGASGGSLVMVESRSRKAAFLREVVRHLNLASTTVETARFEELIDNPDFRNRVDVVTVRAVKIDAERLTAVRSFLTKSGSIFWFTGYGAATPVVEGLQEARRVSLVESSGSALVILKA